MRVSVFKNILIKLKENSEFTYSLVRGILSLLILIYLTLDTIISDEYNWQLLSLSVLHLTYSFINIYQIIKNDGEFFFRQISSMFVDIITLSTLVYVGNLSSVAVYPLYFWIIIGNGIRFGPKYFYTALAVSTVTFFIATTINSSWDQAFELKNSLTIGFIVLALYYNRVIQNLFKMNADLDAVVSERTEELEYQLYHHKLTGLKNIDALKNDIKDHFSSIILIDIDKFQDYNELYGLDVGNGVLKEFADFLQKYADKYNYEAYHVYTDGFFLRSKDKFPMPDIIFENINILLERLSSYKLTFRVDDEDIDIEIDATIAVSMEKDQAIKKANIALKHAKKERRNYLAYYKGLDSHKELTDIIKWRKRIKSAITEDRVVPFFQPIVDSKGKIVKYEALIRLEELDSDGKKEIITPFNFLDIAIRTKQYNTLTRVMMQKSFEAISEMDVDISFNLLFSDIKNSTTMTILKELIQKYNIADRLVLEIVESEDIKDYALLKRFIEQYRAMGVRIAVDDFGSGFSNFKYILEIVPDYLKIDGSLIKEIDKDTNSYKLVSSIVTLASSLGIKTIAEYVHSKEVLDVVKKLGIDEFQGYYFSEPISLEEFKERESKELVLS